MWGLDRKPRRIRIVGSLSEHARAAFAGMDVTAVPAETVISGQVDDDGVQRVLALIQSLGLKIVSVRRANGARKAREHILRPPDGDVSFPRSPDPGHLDVDPVQRTRR